MGLVALLGLIAGLIAFRLITRPLRRLTETMRDFDTEALPLAGSGGGNEIQVLEASFAQMATRITTEIYTLSLHDALPISGAV